VAYELQFFGIDLKGLIFKAKKPFVMSEQGFGGTLANGRLTANLTVAAARPYWGLWPHEGYSPTIDPWQRSNFQIYRRQVHAMLAHYAMSGGGPQYRADAVFM